MVVASPVATLVIIGKESVGKSRLVTWITGQPAYSANYRGSTTRQAVYEGQGRRVVDTPGLIQRSDTASLRASLVTHADADAVVVVVQATHLHDDLADLLPLVTGRRGLVVVTFWDRVARNAAAAEELVRLSASAGVPFVALDTREPRPDDHGRLLAALDAPGVFTGPAAMPRAGWRIEPPASVLERPVAGPTVVLALLLLPAIAAVWGANTVASLVDPVVQALTAELSELAGRLPGPIGPTLAGRFGLITMGPLLFVWAVPTVLSYALILGFYTASGLLDRTTTALQPVARPLGLHGRDLARVMMGFGCNVPAIVSTRACSRCTRSTTVAAISFGAACSYQLGATLAVFAALGWPALVWSYLLFLGATTLLYTRLTAPAAARDRNNLILLDRRVFLSWPRPGAVWQEARGTIHAFLTTAAPIFAAIAVAASLLDWLGALPIVVGALAPVMSLARLPAEAAAPVVFASVRKDGILLFAEAELAATLTPLQALTGVYLSSVLLPCFVTALTIAREQSSRFALQLLARQAAAALVFTLVLAWAGALLGG